MFIHFPQYRNDYTVQIADTLSITSGPSISYVGIDTRSVNLDSYRGQDAPLPTQSYRYPAYPSSVGLAAAGLPSGVYRTLGQKPESPVTFGQRQLEIFGQEYFHVRANLTVSGVLRLELGVLPIRERSFARRFQSCRIQPTTCRGGQPVFEFLLQLRFQGVAAAFNGNFEQVFGSGFRVFRHGQGLHGSVRRWQGSGSFRLGMYKSAFPSAVVDETRMRLTNSCR